jgi:hypothetical protein
MPGTACCETAAPSHETPSPRDCARTVSRSGTPGSLLCSARSARRRRRRPETGGPRGQFPLPGGSARPLANARLTPLLRSLRCETRTPHERHAESARPHASANSGRAANPGKHASVAWQPTGPPGRDRAHRRWAYLLLIHAATTRESASTFDAAWRHWSATTIWLHGRGMA